jgi:hypothetical protein
MGTGVSLTGTMHPKMRKNHTVNRNGAPSERQCSDQPPPMPCAERRYFAIPTIDILNLIHVRYRNRPRISLLHISRAGGRRNGTAVLKITICMHVNSSESDTCSDIIKLGTLGGWWFLIIDSIRTRRLAVLNDNGSRARFRPIPLVGHNSSSFNRSKREWLGFVCREKRFGFGGGDQLGNVRLEGFLIEQSTLVFQSSLKRLFAWIDLVGKGTSEKGAGQGGKRLWEANLGNLTCAHIASHINIAAIHPVSEF